ncbi:MAG: hypothetical protein B7733_09965 [Myxococcales bacterium FL481]|nr:MAG: hypothetical protein B7733_09965 [Myxococcales bacterium FL481]
MNQPQRYALAPTWWFWNDESTLRLAAPWLAVSTTVATLLSGALALGIDSLAAAMTAGATIGLGTAIGCLGLLERHVRKAAVRRR